jgi:hypothetical protein
MNPVVRRIAIHGVLTGVFLGCMGLVFVRVATMGATGPARPQPAPGVQVDLADSDAAFASAVQKVPLVMALWGVGFVVVGESLAHLWRKRSAATPAATLPQQNEAGKLLAELLAKTEGAPPALEREEERVEETEKVGLRGERPTPTRPQL